LLPLEDELEPVPLSSCLMGEARGHSLQDAVIPAKAGIHAVAAGEAGDAIRHIPGFPPSRE